jgi:hypothetical protein
MLTFNGVLWLIKAFSRLVCNGRCEIGSPTPDLVPFRYGDYQRDEWRRIFPVAKIPA